MDKIKVLEGIKNSTLNLQELSFEDSENKVIDFSQLKKKIIYKWRVQSSKQYSTDLVAYIDARDVEDLFDEVCGPENWCCDFKTAGTQMICSIGIFIKGKWVYKSDGGSASNIEAEKGLLSDSFKRAAVKWGVGRFLYRLEIFKLASIDSGRKNKRGEVVYVPMHNVTKHGAAQSVPFGILVYDGREKQITLQIRDVNRYIWEYLKPFMENQRKNK